MYFEHGANYFFLFFVQKKLKHPSNEKKIQKNSNINSDEKKHVLFCLKSFLKPNVFPSWWFQPLWKIWVKLDHFPNEGWKWKMFQNHQLATFSRIRQFFPKRQKGPAETRALEVVKCGSKRSENSKVRLPRRLAEALPSGEGAVGIGVEWPKPCFRRALGSYMEVTASQG